MLFAVKNHWLAAFLLLGIFVAGALGLRQLLGLSWHLDLRPGEVLVAVGVVAASDTLLHGVLWLTLGKDYRCGYRTLVEFFRPQGIREILAGSSLAGGEELVFRGVLLEGLRTWAGLPSAWAVAGAALVFGGMHAFPGRLSVVFTVWSVWEGALLGGVYVATGSLLASVVVHVLHDLAGFSLFAWQRRTGWL